MEINLKLSETQTVSFDTNEVFSHSDVIKILENIPPVSSRDWALGPEYANIVEVANTVFDKYSKLDEVTDREWGLLIFSIKARLAMTEYSKDALMENSAALQAYGRYNIKSDKPLSIEPDLLRECNKIKYVVDVAKYELRKSFADRIGIDEALVTDYKGVVRAISDPYDLLLNLARNIMDSPT